MEKVRIIEYQDKFKDKIKDFIINIVVDEFGFIDWKESYQEIQFDKFKHKKNNFWIVVNDKEEVIGTLGAEKIKKNDIIEFNCFYVDPNYRKCGIAAELFEKFMKFANQKQYKIITLNTHDRFDNAIKFYEKNGFEEYYKDQERISYRKVI